MDEIERLRDQADRYRRMMQTIDDKKAKEAMETLARECDARTAALGKQADDGEMNVQPKSG